MGRSERRIADLTGLAASRSQEPRSERQRVRCLEGIFGEGGLARYDSIHIQACGKETTMQRYVLSLLTFWCVCSLISGPIVVFFTIEPYSLAFGLQLNALLAGAVCGLAMLTVVPRLINAPSSDEMALKVVALEQAERELRHANRDLQQQLLYRGVLERELSIMRTLQFARNQQEIEKSVSTLDAICAELRTLMPEKYRKAPVPVSSPFIDDIAK